MKATAGFRVLFLALLMTVLTTTAAVARSLDEIQEAGVLRVGVSLFTPWTIRNEEGQLFGFEVDVARKLAGDMGVEARLQVLPWDKLIGALEAGEIDLIAAGMAVTPARALRVYFSDPYAEGGITLATNTVRTATVTSLNDLDAAEYRIGAVTGTVSEELAKRIFPAATLVSFEENAAASDALLEGRVDAYLESSPGPRFLALEHPEKIDVPIGKPLLPTRSAFAVARGNMDLVFYLNAWITAREADTWLPSSHAYWFESLRWREQLED